MAAARDVWFSKDLSPFRKAAVGGEDHRALFVAGVDELEEEIAASRRDRQAADFVDDEQRRAAQGAYLFAKRAFTLGLCERRDEIGEGNEVDALSRPDCLDREGRCEVALPCARRPKKVSHLSDLSPPYSCRHR
jgi:hypothetical protein